MNQSQNRLSSIFLIGIGGSGMSGIAEVLHNLGYKISGSDISRTDAIKRLELMGIKVFLGHKASNLNDAEMVVVSSAIDMENPEIVEANLKGLPVLARAEMLSSLMNMKRGIAIAGTHGKTTTTSLVASILQEARLDPTFINGGIINSFATNAKLGKGEYLVAEADESDQSFLMLQPTIAIITNIEEDHLVNYDNDFENLKNAFISFVKKLPFDGLLIACGDDPEIVNLLPSFSRTKVTYGFNKGNDYVLRAYKSEGFKSSFLLSFGNDEVCVRLNMLGRHNALNAAAAFVLALEEGVAISDINTALENFMGISRRMQVIGNLNFDEYSSTLVDDYGHHPSEIRNTIEAIREGHPDKKITMVFQPHRYTRTDDLFDEFLEVLQSVDQLILLDVYSAGEEVIPGRESSDILLKLKEINNLPVNLMRDKQEIIKEIIKSSCSQEGILLMQGAGDISLLSQEIYEQLSSLD